MRTEPAALEYMIRRKILTVVGGKFHIYNAGGEIVGFSHQKAFKLREDIRVFSNESMDSELLRISARQVIDFSACYDVIDVRKGEKVGALRRSGMKSLLKDSWEFLDAADHPIARLSEQNLWLALGRRWISLLNIIPQTFHCLNTVGEKLITFRQNMNPFVHKIRVRIEPDETRTIDPRLAMAGGILLLAIEGRQNS
jgi:hypothetical protein